MDREPKQDASDGNLNDLKDLFSDPESTSAIFHMHASRPGPLVSNEIFLALSEKSRNPKLELIQGLQQPHGSVAKFLKYWLTGLDNSTSEEILSKININGDVLYEDKTFNKESLNANADETFGNWAELTDAIIRPLFSVDDGILVNSGFGFKELDDIKSVKDNSSVSLETVFTEVSLAVVNKILQRYNLPSYEIVKFDPSQIPGLNIKYLQRSGVLNEYYHLLEKKQNHYESAYHTIANLLKSYGGIFPNETQLTKVLQRSWRIDPTFRDLNIDPQEIQYRFENPQSKHKPVLNYMDQIKISILAHKRSIGNKISENKADVYIDGENMVKSMFDIANNQNYFLILQEFMRGTNYDLYKQLFKLYPGLKVIPSSCKIWDTEQFPEFDQNFIKGLKYLKHE
ncbi:hypothetical protein A2366_04650 [Candidatus Woesebacteria bacterium RIFOXYB1_FULL_33_9]|nr:MAG: hypothetical protein A2366_04650 [Candidatus Woesebacteria bacterium RIFOXYB1_FULL_33_9]